MACWHKLTVYSRTLAPPWCSFGSSHITTPRTFGTRPKLDVQADPDTRELGDVDHSTQWNGKKHFNALATVEMFVADGHPSVGASRELGANGAQPLQQTPGKRLVPPPRAAGALQVTQPTKYAPTAAPVFQQTDSRVLRAELSIATSDVKAKSMELARNQLALRQKDRELAQLRATVAEKDARLKSSKAELAGARVRLQQKDRELQHSYEMLTKACKERSELRGELINTQVELTTSKSELMALADDMLKLKAVIESIEDGPDAADIALASDAAATSQQPSTRVGEQLDGALALLMDLTKLSKQMVEEAKQDEELFNTAACLNQTLLTGDSPE